MPALTFFGRISAVSLLIAISAASHAQPAVAASQSSDSSVAAAVPADAPFAATAQTSQPANSDERSGDVLIVKKQYQAAIDAYSGVKQPSAAVWNKMGIAYEMLLDSKSAARCYKESLKVNPNYPGALNNLATLEDANKNFAAAERLYRRALIVNPHSARVYKNLGTNLLMQHKFSESSDAYSQALALDPHILDPFTGPTTVARVSMKDRGEASYLSARSCAQAGLNNCAIEHLRKAFDEGFVTREQVTKDEGFEALRGKPEFERLLAEQQ